MASCYGCGKADAMYAGGYCKNCKPGAEAAGREPANPYAPTAANERDAIVAFALSYLRSADSQGHTTMTIDVFEHFVREVQTGQHLK